MKKFRVVLGYFFIIIMSIFAFGVYILGGISYLSDTEENTCDMTWMFEYPQYVDVKLDDKVEENYPKYKLFVYGEGFATEKLRRMEFNGIPVLFIPGNAGSHQQVRSLASVSLRMALKRRTPYHFDFFTVSLAEEYSALFGGVLKDQTVFVSECLKKIQSLYRGKEEKVILIGHSMGGIIAKAALLHDDKLNINLSNILITLAAPHVSRFSVDKTLTNFYNDIDKNTTRLKDMGVSVISIGGGTRDLLVTSSQIIDKYADINAITTAIPGVWMSTDHLSILWCKQLVIAISRSLFDSIDTRKKKIHEDQDKKMAAFNYHLINKYSGKNLETYEMEMEFDEDGYWIEKTRDFFTWELSDDEGKKKKYGKWIYLMIPMNLEKFNHLSIDAVNLEVKDWVFTCSATEKRFESLKVCKNGWNFTNRTRTLPDYQNRIRKSLDLNLKEIEERFLGTHIVLRIPNSKFPIVHVDLYKNKDRIKKLVGNSFGNFAAFSRSKAEIVENKKGQIRHFVELEEIHDVISLRVYKLSSELENDNKGQIIVELLEPENPISQLRVLTERDLGKTITLRIQTSRPAKLQITNEPWLKFEIKIQQGGIIDKMSSHIRDNWFRMYPVLISILLLSLGTRMNESSSKIPTILITILEIFYYHLTIEFTVSLGIIYILIFSVSLTVIFSGSISHNFVANFLGRAIRLFPSSWYDWLLREGTYERLPLLSTFLLLSLISSSCGALAMLISVPIYFLKLIHMYDDYVEEFMMSLLRKITTRFDGLLKKWKKLKGTDDNENDDNPTITNILNHLIIFLTWGLVAIAAVPSTLVWAKNFSYEKRLSTEDTIMLSSWIVITLWGSLGFVRIPSSPSNNYIKSISIIQRILGWLLLATAGSENPVIYQWLIPPVFAVSITLIVLASLLEQYSTNPNNPNAKN